jgi:uncharacterized membrane protein YfcA
LNLLNTFRRDSRRALSATTLRRILTSAPLALITIAAIALGDRVEWWVWPVLVVIDLIVFAFIGSYLADRDALVAEEAAPAGPTTNSQ